MDYDYGKDTCDAIALLYEINKFKGSKTMSDNTESEYSEVEEYLVDKLVEVSKDAGKGELHFTEQKEKISGLKLELEAVKYQHVQDGKIMDGLNKKLTEKDVYHQRLINETVSRYDKKDAEIERLKGELNKEKSKIKVVSKADEVIVEMCREIVPERRSLTLVGYISEVILKLQSTIKSREAEAESYRELYNILYKAHKSANNGHGWPRPDKSTDHAYAVATVKDVVKQRVFESRYRLEKAKASKLNAEKLEYMNQTKHYLSGSTEKIAIYESIQNGYNRSMKIRSEKKLKAKRGK